MAPLIPAIGLATAKVGISAGTATTIAKGALIAGKVAGVTSKVAGIALPVIGALQAGRETGEQADLEQSIAEGQALQEEIRAAEEARLRRKEGEKTKARQIAKFAKGGVRVGEGTPLLVLAETALDTEADVKAIREGGEGTASIFRRRGQTFRSIGRSAKRRSRVRAGTSLLSGISDLTRSNP